MCLVPPDSPYKNKHGVVRGCPCPNMWTRNNQIWLGNQGSHSGKTQYQFFQCFWLAHVYLVSSLSRRWRHSSGISFTYPGEASIAANRKKRSADQHWHIVIKHPSTRSFSGNELVMLLIRIRMKCQDEFLSDGCLWFSSPTSILTPKMTKNEAITGYDPI